MAGEKDFIENFVPKNRFITAATQTGVLVSRRVFYQEGELGMHCQYVDTGRDETCNYGVLYTDGISWCSGLALWSPGKAGLIHIVPDTEIKVIKAFLARYANGSAAPPKQVFVATTPEHAPGASGFDDDYASKTSLYAATRALVNHYNENIKDVTMIITGFRGRRWSHEAQLAVSAEYGVSIAIPGRGKGDAEKDLAEANNALWLLEEALGPNHPDVLAANGNLALLYYKQGDYPNAKKRFKSLASQSTKVLGSQHPQVATSLHNLALLYGNQGRYAKALPLFRQALSIWEKAVGPKHPNVVTCLENCALLLGKMGCPDEAALFESRAKAIRAKNA